MSILIRNATILDPSSSFNGEKKDLLIQKGRIARIGKGLTDKAATPITGRDLYVSTGWVDVLADYGEPGHEHKETLRTGMDAAAGGGFTDVLLAANTQPAVSTKSVVEFIQKKAAGHNVAVHVTGAVTKNIMGESLAEMMDMHHSGAIAFSDGWEPVQDAGLMLKALEYIKAFDGIIIQLPVHASLSRGNLVNESNISLRLGMSGTPPMAESLMIHRDIELVRYSGSKIHFSGVSTSASLKLIKAAKKEGLAVTCSVTPYHLLFSDEALEGYDSVYKVDPPLRTPADQKALVKALEDGTIDCIATHHRPQDWDAKAKEFEYAEYGMIGQETCWPMLLAAAPKITFERWVELLSLNPRRIFKLPKAKIEENEIAELTLFDSNTEWVYHKTEKYSMAVNSPFLNKRLIGKSKAIF